MAAEIEPHNQERSVDERAQRMRAWSRVRAGGEVASPAPSIDAPPVEAPPVMSRSQVTFALVLLTMVGGAFAVAPLATAVLVNCVMLMFFAAANAMKLVLMNRAWKNNAAIVVDRVRLQQLRDDELPMYTILLPVFKEASMIDQLVAGIVALDYPQDRLDVKLLLEEDDTETRRAVDGRDLPPCFEVVVVADIGPRGKPRACNAGLARAKGEFLVIYDAEDRPERDQLRKSVCAFREVDPNVVCLQAKLNYFNRGHNVLTRWFTAEYSIWFDQLLPGLQAVDAAIPLGGTSNHFVTASLVALDGWEAHNVTEDAELGLRIFLGGWKTAVLDTTTYEEATSRYGNWIRQRSRWVKGYMQTWLAHMRHPLALMRSMGAKAFLVFNLFFGACTICLLLNPFYWFLTAVWFMTRLHWIEAIFPRPVLYVGLVGLFIGNAACVLFTVGGAFTRRNYADVKWAFLAPLYWLFMSIAAYKALVQLFSKPSYWEKTEHGFCRYEDAPDARPSEVAPILRPVD